MAYLSIFRQKFENAVIVIEPSALEFAYLQNFVQEHKMPKFGTKNTLFGYFWAGNFKKYCHI